MKAPPANLGLGVGWRPELALLIERRADLGFVEITADNFAPGSKLPAPIAKLRERGVQVIPHGISLSLGGADRIDMKRVEHLARLAEATGAPLVSEHIAFVRSGDIEIGHLTPLPRTREALEVLIENVRAAMKLLPVPLALENIAAPFDWPCAELEEGRFIRELLEATGAWLLLDISNAYANARNGKRDGMTDLLNFPLEKLAYVHMGGGVERDGFVHDTHSDPVLPGAIELLDQLCASAAPPGVMLERDDHFPGEQAIHDELDSIAGAVARGARSRQAGSEVAPVGPAA